MPALAHRVLSCCWRCSRRRSCWADLFRNRDAEIAQAKHGLDALASYATQDLSDKVGGSVQLLYGLSRAADLDALDQHTCSAFLANVLERYPQ